MNAPAPLIAQTAAQFEHQHAAHCESGVMANLLRHHGVHVSEPLVFGLSSALSFAYLPFIKLGGLPLVAYRMPPKAIIKGLQKPFGISFRFETFRSPEAGQQRLDALLREQRVVGLQTSVYWLPYFPEDMRFHFNAHNLLVYGKDGDEYLISDPVGEDPVRCATADMNRARFAKGVLAPKGLLYYPQSIARTDVASEDVLKAIRKTARIMRAPIPLFGAPGMRTLARAIERLKPEGKDTGHFIGHVVRMQEEIGTGGGGFRFLYSAFLQEAAEITQRPALAGFAEQMLAIGDDWRAFALASARMLRGRDPMQPRAIGALLRKQADAESLFFRDLSKAAS
ncbi:BtrH N-terminal domain-containing protein [Uliginosibacterium sp. H3]|uniref:BtrH N-terminal domain-containing protein n=1 Tax=Uliginosibacterium silvisoli TaxID=3114758 RepID=A0ABU6K3W8_9RHOO|nr:BtrH N-terminal domain-containing protein [Uliginosibacterium sp. H3]